MRVSVIPSNMGVSRHHQYRYESIRLIQSPHSNTYTQWYIYVRIRVSRLTPRE